MSITPEFFQPSEATNSYLTNDYFSAKLHDIKQLLMTCLRVQACQASGARAGNTLAHNIAVLKTLYQDYRLVLREKGATMPASTVKSSSSQLSTA